MDQLFLFSVSLDTFIQSIAKQGGMSFSNGYDVEFYDFSTRLSNNLGDFIGPVSTTGDETKTSGLIQMLCDEAQLPNVQAAVGQLSGRVMGESQISYPYARFYSDLSLTWMCDANMIPLKFLNTWHSFIFNGNNFSQDGPKPSAPGLKNIKQATPNEFNRAIRLNYPVEYMCKLRVSKTEKGPGAPNERSAVSYIMENIYPYSIDSIPLSYGTSQITKVTANFYYQKHTVVHSQAK